MDNLLVCTLEPSLVLLLIGASKHVRVLLFLKVDLPLVKWHVRVTTVLQGLVVLHALPV